MKMTTVYPITCMVFFNNLFYIGKWHSEPWLDLQKLFRKVFVKIMLKCEKRIFYVTIQF